jgi:4'-phosphopantetheinyl transferase
MPLIYKALTEQKGRIGVWRIEENADFFLQKLIFSDWERSYFERITHPKRRAGWLASRYLIKLLLETDDYVELLFDTNGKPILPHGDWRLSISHTHDFAAVYLSTAGDVGVDIESSTRSVVEIRNKFLHKEELNLLGSPTEKDLLVYWGAKEAMYKIHGRKKLDFRDHMRVDPIDPAKGDTFKGIILKDKLIRCSLWFRIADGYCLVAGTSDEN